MKIINRVLLLICDTAWMRTQLVGGWRMTGVNLTVDNFGTTMGRGWDDAGRRMHRERNARWRAVASDIAARGGLDLVFMVTFDDVLEDETLIHFKKLDAKLVLYNADMLTQWYRVIRTIKFMDLLCYGSSDHLDYFVRRGVALFDFGCAAVPPTSEELAGPVIRYDGIMFAGSPWPYRQMVLQKIAAAGIPLRIYGHSWDRKGSWPATPGIWRKAAHDIRNYLVPRLREEGPQLAGHLLQRLVPNKEAAIQANFAPGIIEGEYDGSRFVAMVRGAAINLGFTQMLTDVGKEYPRMIRVRDFEIPMAGGFYLAQNCPELAKYYELGREIAVWDTASDVVDCCRYYLDRPDERARIAEAARRRALKNHTWLHRFSSVAAALGMRLPISDLVIDS
jgi:hypothetical protein